MKNLIQKLARLNLDALDVLSEEQKRNVRGGYGGSSCPSGPVRLYINNNCSDGFQTCGCSDCNNLKQNYTVAQNPKCVQISSHTQCFTSPGPAPC